MAEQLDSIALLDTDLLFRLKYFSDTFNIPLRLVVQNLLIKEWARCAAIIEVEGANSHRMLPEFSKELSEDGKENVVTGEDLFNSLVEVYKKELIDQKNNIADLEKSYQTVLAKYLRTAEGKAELERDRNKAMAEYEKRKQNKL
jgi:hypothetical protein